MKQICIFLSLAALSLAAVSASARCMKDNEVVTLDGVLTLSAAYVSPRDFGWAPKNGFVSYAVLVLRSPVCLDSEGEISDEVRVLQIGSANLPSNEALRKGVAVRVQGTLFSGHTAHHFTPVLINASQLTLLN